MPKTSERGVPLTAGRLRELLKYDPATGVFSWRVQRRAQSPTGAVAGTIRKDGYVIICVAGKQCLAHRLAWLYVHGQWPASLLDHRNANPTDNRLSNLREADKSKNAGNGRGHKDSITGLKGAHPCRGKFKAEISIDGRNRHIGVFETAEEAHAAYCKKANEVFGEFARAS